MGRDDTNGKVTDGANILAQLSIPAAVETALYTVANGVRCRVQGMTFCNTSGLARSFRMAFCPLGAPNHPADWVYFDLPTAANDTFLYEVDLILKASDSIRVFSAAGGMSVTLYGQVL